MSRIARAGALAAALLLTGSLAARPALASPETLRRSLGNILQAPLDVALSPIVAARSLRTNLERADDPRAVQIAFAVPGFAWNTAMCIGGGVLREITGVIELVPGLALLFFEPDLDPMYAPVERGDALVDSDTRPMHWKFGIDYTSVPF